MDQIISRDVRDIAGFDNSTGDITTNLVDFYLPPVVKNPHHIVFRLQRAVYFKSSVIVTLQIIRVTQMHLVTKALNRNGLDDKNTFSVMQTRVSMLYRYMLFFNINFATY